MSIQGARSCSSCIVKLIVTIVFMFGMKQLVLHHHHSHTHKLAHNHDPKSVKSQKVPKNLRISIMPLDQHTVQINEKYSKYVREHENRKCEAVKNLFFLKTSKTGSQTLMGIIHRFGLKYGLSFLLGRVHNGFESGPK